jgi:flagellar L-ring protein precursor FlgH
VIFRNRELYIPGVVRGRSAYEADERAPPARWERAIQALRKVKEMIKPVKQVRVHLVPVSARRRAGTGLKRVSRTVEGALVICARGDQAPAIPTWGLFEARRASVLVLLIACGVLHAQVVAVPQAVAVPVTNAATVAAQPAAKSAAKHMVTPGNPAASSLEAYLARVRLDTSGGSAAPGAIWTDAGRLTRMTTDVRAMRPHDLISVVVSESLAAETDGTVKNSRASNANSSITGLIGALKAGNALQNLISQSSSSGLNGQGTSASNSSLTTTFGGQVVEVLPNGMLVIEAARQVEFSQQVQTIVLRGLVRPEDISQQNQVVSTAISSLELQVRGKGIINDYTHRQNVLVRMLRDILVF